MGRILSKRPGQAIPSQNTDLSFRMTKLAAPVEEEVEVEECVVAVSGLFWQDEITKEFDVSSDITEQL